LEELVTAKKHFYFRIAGLVGFINNDMALTDLAIGTSTAFPRICESIDNINTTASFHSRAVDRSGQALRLAGSCRHQVGLEYLAVFTAPSRLNNFLSSAEADLILIPEPVCRSRYIGTRNV